jgi:alpha/beta superfamily hydrolase
MEHGVVQTAKKAFLDSGYVVIAFDSRYSLGEGNNDVEKVRLSTFAADLETVVNWAKTQSFYSEPFALAGHSLGGASVINFGAKYPAQVDVLIPITPVISGNLWESSCMLNMTDFCRQWQQNKTYKYTDPQNHKTAIIPYAVVTDSKKYNAYVIAPQIKAKTLLIAAENDIVISPSDVQKLAKITPTGKYIMVKSADHNFENKKNKISLYQTITSFLE